MLDYPFPPRNKAPRDLLSRYPKSPAQLIISQPNLSMLIGDHIRAIREAKSLSQGDIEKRAGLLRAYISRIENGHTIPSVETLEKFARALEVPLYQLFYAGEEPPKLPHLPKRKTADEIAFGSSGKEERFLTKLRQLLGRMSESNRRLLLHMAQKMAKR